MVGELAWVAEAADCGGSGAGVSDCTLLIGGGGTAGAGRTTTGIVAGGALIQAFHFFETCQTPMKISEKTNNADRPIVSTALTKGGKP